MPLLTIARLSMREIARRRLLLALVVLTAIIAVATAWGFHKIIDIHCGTHPCSPGTIRVAVATLLIMLMFMFSFVVAMAAAFIAAPAIAGEIDSGLILAILPRPLRRSDLVLGKWLGLSFMVALYVVVAAGLEYLLVQLATGFWPPHPLLAIAFITAEGISVVTLALALSTRLPGMTAGIIVLILFGMMWIGGIAGSIGAAFDSSAVAEVGTITSLILPTDGLWRGAMYNLEPAALLFTAGGRSANPFLSSQAPTTAYLLWVLLWLAAVLGLGVLSFNRREL